MVPAPLIKTGSKDETRMITLEDLEVRYEQIRSVNPKVRQCTVRECKNPRDSTKYLGEDTSCAYHRLLFDAWSSECMDMDKLYYIENQRARRGAFTRWRNKLGKEKCDSIVLRLAQEPINWVC